MRRKGLSAGFRVNQLAPALALACLALALAGCSHAARADAPGQADASLETATIGRGQLTRHLRISGATRAVSAYAIRIPELNRQGGQLTLTAIVANGAQVKTGDVLAQFDATTEEQNARDAQAKFQDLSHQVDDRIAQNRSNAEQRASDLQQARSDLRKAELELRKAPILSPIDAQTDELNLEDARAHVADLQLEDANQAKADAANLRVLQLQRDQQQIEWQRSLDTAAKLTLRAPIAGMVALADTYHDGVMSPSQPGDQLYTGDTLLHIFDPSRMEVIAQINEADGASLAPGLGGVMRLDAYPQVPFRVQFLDASPIATSPRFVSPVRSFSARFLVQGSDPRLLPDLSCAVDLEVKSAPDVLLAPRAALEFIQGEPYLEKRTPQGWTRQRVQLGTFNDRQVVILGGVRAGDVVRVQPPDAAAAIGGPG